MSQKIKIPEPVQTLTDSEMQRAKLLCLKVPYPVNFELMQINCPYNQIEQAIKNKYVDTLCVLYKFSLQSTIV